MQYQIDEQDVRAVSYLVLEELEEYLRHIDDSEVFFPVFVREKMITAHRRARLLNRFVDASRDSTIAHYRKCAWDAIKKYYKELRRIRAWHKKYPR